MEALLALVELQNTSAKVASPSGHTTVCDGPRGRQAVIPSTDSSWNVRGNRILLVLGNETTPLLRIVPAATVVS